MSQLTDLTLPSAREALKRAQATMLNAQQTFDRTTEPAAHGNATRVALDAAKKDLDISRAQVRTAELQVATALPGGSDGATGQTMLNQACAAADTAQSRLGYATIRAPRADVLIARTVERGTVAQIGQSLLTLAPDGEIQLLLAIDERNLAKLSLGETVIASADAYADQQFAAVVSHINPAVEHVRRPAAARRDRPRACHAARPGVGRPTDRQPRFGYRRHGFRHAAQDQP